MGFKQYPLRLGLALVAGLTILVVSGCSVLNATGVFVEPRELDDHAEWLSGHVTVHLPDTASGPVPTAILFHGCGGRRAMQDDYAAALNEAGYGAMIVDSMTPRQIGRAVSMTQVCTAMRLWGQERASDVFASVALARTHSAIDAERLILVGWSHGGWALLDALSYVADDQSPTGLSGPVDLDGVQTAVLMYPYCSLPSRSRRHEITAGIAIDAVLAGRDMVASTADCRHTLNLADRAGADVSYDIWPNVTHAFDEAGNPDPRMQYDAGAARAAHQRVIAILDGLSDD